MNILSATRRAVVAPRPWPQQLALALSFVIVATGVRWFVDKGANGVPFASFLPFVVIASILLDLRFALLVAVASMFTAAAVFLKWDDPTPARAFLTSTYIITASLMLAIGHQLRVLIIDLDRHARQFELFNTELQHRLKNTLQMICAMARVGTTEIPPAKFYADLTDRVQTLNRANEYLGITRHRQGQLLVAVQLAVEPFADGVFIVEGSDCLIDGETGMRLMMALHELCTNAQKYGALSRKGGRVEIRWSPQPGGTVRLEWEEHGGPPVEHPPRHRGLGSRLLAQCGGLQGVRLDFCPQGLRCTMELRMAGVPN